MLNYIGHNGPATTLNHREINAIAKLKRKIDNRSRFANRIHSLFVVVECDTSITKK